jgi:hypothetical protein
MPPKEELLFCKIAIMNGLVSETDAQKVLTLCDKREKEAGRRPSIGAVFSKYNLMRTRDVEKVYDAVRKRSGSSVGLPKAGSKSTTMRSRSGRSTLRSVKVDPARMEKVKGQKGLDNTTLFLGIGSGVVFVGILLTMILLMTSGGKKPEDVARTPVAEKSEAKIEAPKAPLPKPAAPKPAEAAKVTELPQQVRHDMISRISDARGMDDPKKALSYLEEFQQKLLADYGLSPPELNEAIAGFREAAKSAGAEPPKPPEGEQPEAKPEAEGEGKSAP